MKTLALVLTMVVSSAIAQADEVWRWTATDGTVHYSNLRSAAPAEATTVDTRIVVEAKTLPRRDGGLVITGGRVVDADAPRANPAPQEEPYRIYTEERLRFGCYAANVLFSGGFSHPDDITVVGNCLPYVLGPDAWLNAARAELGLRQNGIAVRDVMRMYSERDDD